MTEKEAIALLEYYKGKLNIDDAIDMAIIHGKEKRKPYRGSKAIDCTCRNHGSCKWCRDNRLYKFRKRGEIWQKQY